MLHFVCLFIALSLSSYSNGLNLNAALSLNSATDELSQISATDELNARENGCPEKHLIEPCICFDSGFSVLLCQHVEDTDTLRKVFKYSARYSYQEVHIEHTVAQYLPYDSFKDMIVHELHLKNVTLMQLFDDVPEDMASLLKIHIENTVIFRGMTWDLLANCPNLQILNVYYESVPVLDSEFSSHVTHGLKQISFYGTNTASLKSGVLADFKDLFKVAFDACELTEIRRDIFPVPFDVKVMYFNNNKIRTIPDDMFTDMPFLQTLGLKDNSIVHIPSYAFEGSFRKMEYLFLEGNPLACDCRMKWLLARKPVELTGFCVQPLSLVGRPLKSLHSRELNCPFLPEFEQQNKISKSF